DLRVDDHPDPIKELIRIYQLQQMYFAPSKRERVVLIEGETKAELERHLQAKGYAVNSKDELLKSLTAYLHTENFEMREQKNGYIDLDVLDFMKK
ncbi:MAG: putative peptidoglycan binding domain-containing protein, partial [Bacillus sp. (in: firmicutes)]